MKTVEDFKKQAKNHSIKFWNIHNCSMCGYECGYIIRGDKLFYDSGCNCGFGIDVRPVDWEEMVDHYNRNQRENNKDIKQKYLDEMDEFWKFKN